MDYLKIAKRVIQELEAPDPDLLEPVLKGLVIELWCDMLGERFWLVADVADAELLGEPRGTTYTASEARMLVRVTDPDVVLAVIQYKARFDGLIKDFKKESP